MFVELNDKDAYCAHINFMNVRNFNAFMNIHQLKMSESCLNDIINEDQN